MKCLLFIIFYGTFLSGSTAFSGSGFGGKERQKERIQQFVNAFPVWAIDSPLENMELVLSINNLLDEVVNREMLYRQRTFGMLMADRYKVNLTLPDLMLFDLNTI